jgi:hypothetical protein
MQNVNPNFGYYLVRFLWTDLTNYFYRIESIIINDFIYLVEFFALAQTQMKKRKVTCS